jgi:hypothetical protein
VCILTILESLHIECIFVSVKELRGLLNRLRGGERRLYQTSEENKVLPGDPEGTR